MHVLIVGHDGGLLSRLIRNLEFDLSSPRGVCLVLGATYAVLYVQHVIRTHEGHVI